MNRAAILVGLPAAGKSVIAEIVGKKLDIPIIETSPFVFKSVEERGLQPTPENIKTVSTELKAQSDSYYTERALEFAQQEYKNKPMVFFSGMRAMSEVKYLKNTLGEKNVIVIAFHASQSTRFRRIANPDRAGGTGPKAEEDKRLLDFNIFTTREEKELGFGIGNVFAMSDYIIANDDLRFPYNGIKKSTADLEIIIRSFICGEE